MSANPKSETAAENKIPHIAVFLNPDPYRSIKLAELVLANSNSNGSMRLYWTNGRPAEAEKMPGFFGCAIDEMSIKHLQELAAAAAREAALKKENELLTERLAAVSKLNEELAAKIEGHEPKPKAPDKPEGGLPPKDNSPNGRSDKLIALKHFTFDSSRPLIDPENPANDQVNAKNIDLVEKSMRRGRTFLTFSGWVFDVPKDKDKYKDENAANVERFRAGAIHFGIGVLTKERKLYSPDFEQYVVPGDKIAELWHGQLVEISGGTVRFKQLLVCMRWLFAEHLAYLERVLLKELGPETETNKWLTNPRYDQIFSKAKQVFMAKVNSFTQWLKPEHFGVLAGASYRWSERTAAEREKFIERTKKAGGSAPEETVKYKGLARLSDRQKIETFGLLNLIWTKFINEKSDKPVA